MDEPSELPRSTERGGGGGRAAASSGGGEKNTWSHNDNNNNQEERAATTTAAASSRNKRRSSSKQLGGEWFVRKSTASLRPGITPLVSADPRLAMEIVLDNNKNRESLSQEASGSSLPGNHKAGTFTVFMTACETMWGIILFVKFSWVVGTAGLLPTLGAVLLSVLVQLLTCSSLSAVATNGVVPKSGGAYYMLAKGLGAAPGAAIAIMYYVGMATLAAVELAGGVDGAQALLRQLDKEDVFGVGEYWTHVILCLIGLVLVLGLRVFTSQGVRHAIGTIVMVIFFLAITACCTGVLASLGGSWTPEHLAKQQDYRRPSGQNLRDNLGLEGVSASGFSSILVFVYPSFLGISQGVNLCPQLEKPFESMPKGIFMAVLTSMTLYVILFIILALAAPPDVLLSNQDILLVSAWPTMYFSYASAIAVGLCSAVSCIEVAPLILQSVAEEGSVRVLNAVDLGRISSWNNEPNRAIALTALLILPFMFVAELDLIAETAAVCFLCMYASMHLACFLQSVLRLPSWRPHFSLYTWFTALLGCLGCLFIMFFMTGIVALLVLLLALILYLYIELTSQSKSFGHGILGVKYHLALNSLLGIEENDLARRLKAASQGSSSKDLKNSDIQLALDFFNDSNLATTSQSGPGFWQPQVLVFLPSLDDPMHEDTYDRVKGSQLLSFASQLKQSSGLTIVGAVIAEKQLKLLLPQGDSVTSLDGDPQYSGAKFATNIAGEYDYIKHVKLQVMTDIAKHQISGFAEVVTAPDYLSGLTMLLQLSGLGSLRPNTCFLAWPEVAKGEPEIAARSLEFIAKAAVHEKTVVVLKLGESPENSFASPPSRNMPSLKGLSFEPFPTSSDRLKGNMDVWWIVHDNGILMLIAYLVQRHAVWRGCKLRFFTVVKAGVDNVDDMTKDLRAYLHALRIQAEVKVVNLESPDEEPPPPVSRTSVEVAAATRGKNFPRQGSLFEPVMLSLNKSLSAGLENHINIKQAILENSKDADSVFLNLPPPPGSSWEDPCSYFELVEFVTRGLKRVVIVYASGTEVLSRYM